MSEANEEALRSVTIGYVPSGKSEDSKEQRIRTLEEKLGAAAAECLRLSKQNERLHVEVDEWGNRSNAAEEAVSILQSKYDAVCASEQRLSIALFNQLYQRVAGQLPPPPLAMQIILLFVQAGGDEKALNALQKASNAAEILLLQDGNQ